MRFLDNLLDSAASGNEAAVAVLRRVCVIAAERVTTYDLVALGRCLYALGVEAAAEQARRN